MNSILWNYSDERCSGVLGGHCIHFNVPYILHGVPFCFQTAKFLPLFQLSGCLFCFRSSPPVFGILVRRRSSAAFGSQPQPQCQQSTKLLRKWNKTLNVYLFLLSPSITFMYRSDLLFSELQLRVQKDWFCSGWGLWQNVPELAQQSSQIHSQLGIRFVQETRENKQKKPNAPDGTRSMDTF